MQHHLTFFAQLVLSPASIICTATCIVWPVFSRLWVLHRQHAARYESEFLEDMDALGCRRPDVMTRVSEYMTEIVEYIQTIMSNNMAYESNGSVHFDTQAFRYMHLGDLPTPDAMCRLNLSSHTTMRVYCAKAISFETTLQTSFGVLQGCWSCVRQAKSLGCGLSSTGCRGSRHTARQW